MLPSLKLPSLLAFALAFLVFPGLLEARPVVEVGNLKSLKSGNVGETFLGEAGGRVWFFKADGPVEDIQRYGNFEAEVLVPLILQQVGIQAPQARVVDLAGRKGPYLQMELVDLEFTGGGKPVELKKRKSDRILEGVDPAEVRLLQLIDILIGNGDRHDGNLFLVPRPDGSTGVIPIDNNLALATPSVVFGYYNWHLVRGFRGVSPGKDPADPGGLLYPNNANLCGHPTKVMERNSLYLQVWQQSQGRPEGLAQYVQLAHRLRELLPDPVLKRLVEQLPEDAVTFGDPAARKREILELLRFRRDGLADAFRELFADSDAPVGRGLEYMKRVLPASLRSRLGLGEDALLFLSFQLFKGKGSFHPVDAYAQLRATGVEKLLARETIKFFCKAENRPYPAKEILLADRQGAIPSPGSAYQTYRHAFPQERFGRLHGHQEGRVPLDQIRVMGEKKGLSIRDARGRNLTKDLLAPYKSAMRAGLKAGHLRSGETLVLERDGFEPQSYRGRIEDASGGIRWTGRLALEARPNP